MLREDLEGDHRVGVLDPADTGELGRDHLGELLGLRHAQDRHEVPLARDGVRLRDAVHIRELSPNVDIASRSALISTTAWVMARTLNPLMVTKLDGGMKPDIHPQYGPAHVRCTCGNEFWTRSTKPELHVEICSNCHPFYTGRQKLVDTGGRVERFRRRAARSRR